MMMDSESDIGMNESKKRERGQVLVLFVLLLAALCGFVSLAIDVGLFMHEQQNLQNVVDASALAAAQELPDNGAAATTVARQYATNNDTSISGAALDVTFRCIVGDRNGNGQPDPADIGPVCNPGGGAVWHCSGAQCWAMCAYSGANKCNTVVVGANKDVPFFFGPVLSLVSNDDVCFLSECNTGAIRAAACRGACGLPPSVPLDVDIVLDRTGSMSATELANAKNGAKAVATIFDPQLQHLGLTVLPGGDVANTCNATANVPTQVWRVVNLSSNYQNADGSLNNSSQLITKINCLNTATFSGSQTNLGTPTKEAKNELLANGRADVTHGIIFMTDGEANLWDSTNSGYYNCGANAAVTSSAGDNNGFQTTPGNACADGGGTAQDPNTGTNTNTSCSNTGKDKHQFYNYGISAPTPGQAPLGIEVRLDGYISSTSSTSTRKFCVELSWNGGASWTSAQSTSNITTSEQSYVLGGPTDNWGHNFTEAELANANFRVRVTSLTNNNSRTMYLDWVTVRAFWPPNGSAALGPCDYAVEQATIAKSLDPAIEIFTIGYGVEGATCNNELAGSPWVGKLASQTLAAMATASSDDGGDGPGGIGGGCDTTAERNGENGDGDHFLCEASSGNLAPIFAAAAESLSQGARLIRLPS